MNEYKYYIFDNKEYYEIWNGENLLKSESGDFCEGLLSLYNDIHYSRQTGEMPKKNDPMRSAQDRFCSYTRNTQLRKNSFQRSMPNFRMTHPVNAPERG